MELSSRYCSTRYSIPVWPNFPTCIILRSSDYCSMTYNMLGTHFDKQPQTFSHSTNLSESASLLLATCDLRLATTLFPLWNSAHSPTTRNTEQYIPFLKKRLKYLNNSERSTELSLYSYLTLFTRLGSTSTLGRSSRAQRPTRSIVTTSCNVRHVQFEIPITQPCRPCHTTLPPA